MHQVYKHHSSSCALRTHLDANDDTKIEWANSTIGRAILAAGYGKAGIDMRMRWDGAQKMLVPLERPTADELLKAVPDRPYSGKITAMYHINTLQRRNTGRNGVRPYAATMLQ